MQGKPTVCLTSVFQFSVLIDLKDNLLTLLTTTELAIYYGLTFFTGKVYSPWSGAKVKFKSVSYAASSAAEAVWPDSHPYSPELFFAFQPSRTCPSKDTAWPVEAGGPSLECCT